MRGTSRNKQVIMPNAKNERDYILNKSLPRMPMETKQTRPDEPDNRTFLPLCNPRLFNTWPCHVT